ncbi:hypothetical protein VJ918_09760 [Adlercreutzia sp. R21]|uniref:hypothetical protein n=1 Tax=Adlercreutzia wanghongyangiae TaxID=3111451 RepID=UPI002DBB981E|nr:hypothetical protein [Adlercreutzia sp. R21]MEC4185093.1 hypothetical protein [Adlercreutzia sp. R21]
MSKHTIEVPLSDEIDASTVDDLKILKKDLGAMGVRLTIPNTLPGGTLVFEYDDEAHKRNAGRKKKAIPADSELSEMTQAQMDEWLIDTPIAEIQETLDVGRATAYRRVREARSRVVYAVVSLADTDDNQEGGEDA